MATLQKIRNRAGLLIAIIVGMALFAFVLGDLFRSGQSMFADSEFSVAEIDGKTIPLEVYQAKIDEFITNYKTQTGNDNLDERTIDMIRDQAWEFLMKEALMNDAYLNLGLAREIPERGNILGVSSEELFDMVQGRNIDPQIQQIPGFQNEMGMFDRARMIQYLKTLENNPEQYQAWIAFEEGLMKARISTKYNNLIKKGYYVNSLMAKHEADEKNNKVNFNFIALRYNSIADSTIIITDSDLKAYYDEHIEDYKQDASRDIEYVVFDIRPSEQDIKDASDWIVDAKNDLAEAEDITRFLAMNSDGDYDNSYYKKEEITLGQDTILFDSVVGTIYGPYRDGDSFVVTMVEDVKQLPDSVKASHILIQPSDNLSYPDAIALADSLAKMIKEGKADFEALASQYNQDATKEKGGDLGWFQAKAMVQPFSDTCFFSDKGHITTVTTQFGVHVVKVVDRAEANRKVRLARMVKDIIPSSATYQFIYSQAGEFAGLNNTQDKFNAAVQEKGLAKRIANNVLESDKNISGLESPREVIRWAYGAEKGDVSAVFELGERLVIAVLTEVREEGTATMEQVRAEIEIAVTKDKKAEKLMAELQSKMAQAKTLDDLAAASGVTVRNADNISFSMANLPGVGVEPVVIATATNIEKGKLVGPVKGNNGVYAVEVTEIMNAPELANVMLEKQTLSRGFINRSEYQLFEAIKNTAEIVDNRAKYF